MFSINDIDTIESPDDSDSPEVYYRSVQRAINSGMWSLQGSYGRTMMDAIEGGHCVLGREGVRDYWGNYIPSRFEVLEGTKGSVEFVADQYGDAWADFIAEVE